VADLDSFERIERLIASAEARRNGALRDEVLQRATEEVIDGEFENVSQEREANPNDTESEEEWADQ
jgi:hypothetical protein